MMSDVLGVVLEILRCDRTFLMHPCDPDARVCQARMERTVPGYPGVGALGVEVEVAPEMAAGFRVLLGAAGPVTFGEMADVPLGPGVFQRYGFHSQMGMVLDPKSGKPWMFGLHQCSGPRIWTKQEKALFQEAGRRLTDGLTSLLSLESLKKSERHLQIAQAMAHAGSWERDLDTGRVMISDEALRIVGLQRRDRASLGHSPRKRLRELVHPEDRELVATAYEAALREGRHDVECRIVRPDGEMRYLRSVAALVRDESGRPRAVSATVQDITDAKLSEASLRQLNRKLHAISNCNQILIRAEDEQSLLDRICSIICKEAGYRMAWVGYAEDGPEKRVRPVAWSGAAEGYLAGARVSWADSERGRGPTGTAIRRGKTVSNPDFETNPNLAPWLEEARRSGFRSSIALPLKDENGATFGALTIYSEDPGAFTSTEIELLEALAGDLAFGICTLRARISVKQAGQERQAHTRFLECLDRVNRAIQAAGSLDRMMSDVLDIVLDVLQCDRAFLMYPCDPEAKSWSSPMERTRPEYPGILKLALEMPMDPDVARCLRVLLDAGRPVKFGPGTDIPLAADVSEKFGIKSFMAVALRPRVGKPWQFGVHQCSRARTWAPEEERLLQEIGGRLADGLSTMLVQRNLQESEAKYRRIVDTALEGIGGIGPDGRITFVNGRLAGILGYSADELPGRPITDFILEGDLDEYRRFMERRHQGISEQLERRFKHKDGHTVWTIVSSVPVFDEARNYTGTFAMLTDISERKCAEEALRQLNQELEQRVAGRTAALEQANNELESFSYSVSHDLRAPLRAIDGFSRILSEEYDAVLGEQGRRYTGTIASNAKRMGQLINDILDFSRMSRREIAATPVDMTALAREVYEEVRAAAPAERAIVLRMADLPPASADPALLRQVWVNLLSNAVKYTGQRAEAVIEVGGSTASGENTYWVKDNGAGFDMRYADKLFGVFQRLHGDAEFEGTGIGLAIVKRIVTRHGGRVWAESGVGKGTAMYFTLPASQQQCGS